MGSHGPKMVRKWFEHKRCISLDKLAEYINQFNLYEEELDKHDRKWLNHPFGKEHDKERPDCECLSMPGPPQKPVLKDYTASEEDGCNIVDLMDHPQMERLRAINWATLFQAPKIEFLEKEAEDREGSPGPDADQRDKNGPAVR